MSRALAIVTGALLVLGLGAAALPGVRNSREDLAAIRRDADGQLVAIRLQVELAGQQPDVVRRQLGVAEEQRRVSRETLDVAWRQLGLAEQLLGLLRAQLAKTDEGLAMQRELLKIARETLEQVREINRKTPDLTPS